MADLFVAQQQRLHSGIVSNWKIECDSLTDGDIALLARLMAERIGQFSAVEGVPRGGLRIANELRRYAWSYGPLVIVDDVCTTGNSLETQRAGREAIGFVIFARGPTPSWARALFTLDDPDVSRQTFIM